MEQKKEGKKLEKCSEEEIFTVWWEKELEGEGFSTSRNSLKNFMCK